MGFNYPRRIWSKPYGSTARLMLYINIQLRSYVFGSVLSKHNFILLMICLIWREIFDKDLDDGEVDEILTNQMQKEKNRISQQRQSNIPRTLSNPVNSNAENGYMRRASIASHKRSSRTSTVSRGRSSLIAGKRVSVMDPTIDIDLENNPRLLEARPSKPTEPQKPSRRTSRSSKMSKDWPKI